MSARLPTKKTKAERDRAAFRIGMAKRLALAWDATPYKTDLRMDADDVANWLQISPEEARFLFTSGLLTVVPSETEWGFDTVEFAELVWLIKESGWFERRAKVHLEFLEREVVRLPKRAEVKRREAELRAQGRDPHAELLADVAKRVKPC